MSKKRILICAEFSELATGFATYMKGILPHLYNTDKYIIAEHAVYCDETHLGIDNVPWKVYPNQPHPHSSQEVWKAFYADKDNQFGKWRFNETLLAFQADIVINISDFWMQQFINKSPYRRHFKYLHMPTCDGQPQKTEWLNEYRQCDVLTTYSYWAKNVLETESGGLLKISAVTSPGTDTKLFRPPEDKSKLRQKFGLSPDLMIFQTVMRNQPRKLFPDLMRAFAKYLDLCRFNGREDLYQKSFLYLHTTFPDVGWDLPTEIKRHKLTHKIFFTYMCRACGHVQPYFFSGDITFCPHCGNKTFKFPDTSIGVSKETLAQIQSLPDLYIQYSICEGSGMPQADAKACGVPILSVDYSAMTEQAHAPGGIPIKVIRYFQESQNQTGQLRALPDNDDAARKMFEFASQPREEREKLGLAARQHMVDHYDWEKVAQKWERIIDATPVPSHNNTWLSPPKYIHPNLQIPNNLSNEQFIHWCYANILQQPTDLHSYEIQQYITVLNQGYQVGQNEQGYPIRQPINREIVLQKFLNDIQYYNQMEQLRYHTLVLKDKAPQLETNFVEI